MGEPPTLRRHVLQRFMSTIISKSTERSRENPAHGKVLCGTPSEPSSDLACHARCRDQQPLDQTPRAASGALAAEEDHVARARAYEEAGLAFAALREYQCALVRDPHDAEALRRLSVLYHEQGDTRRAMQCLQEIIERDKALPEDLERLGILRAEGEGSERGPELTDGTKESVCAAGVYDFLAAPDRAESPSVRRPALDDETLLRILHRFSGREGIYARQWVNATGDVGYSPVREHLTTGTLRRHLEGKVTLGVYPIRIDGTVPFFAFDLDIAKAALVRAAGHGEAALATLRDFVHRKAVELRRFLRELGIETVLEDSGYKGRHLWGFLAEPAPAQDVHRFGVLVSETWPRASDEVDLEFFPKQPRVGRGPGNLIKLPLGVHRKSGKRSMLLDEAGVAITAGHSVLADPPLVARRSLEAAIEVLHGKGERAKAHPARAQPDAGSTFPHQTRRSPAIDVGYAADPSVTRLLKRCRVLGEIERRCKALRQLSYDEEVVLKHTLGHTQAGVLAVNYLLSLCRDANWAGYLKTPLGGDPISCAKIRRRVPDIVREGSCACRFLHAPERYASPIIHLAVPKGEKLDSSTRGGVSVRRGDALSQNEIARCGEVADDDSPLWLFVEPVDSGCCGCKPVASTDVVARSSEGLASGPPSGVLNRGQLGGASCQPTPDAGRKRCGRSFRVAYL